MTILCDREIKKLVESHQMIEGFDHAKLNSFGYDITLSRDFLIPSFDYALVSIIDPLDLSKIKFDVVRDDFCVIPPNSFILGKSVEKFNMPPDIMGICLGRSSYARCGIITNVTPLEAGWRGTVTMEISNSTPLPVKVHANKGIVQVLFFKGSLPDRDYSTKGGRYQNQEGITLPRGL